MTRLEHLLTCAAEECAEIAQRITKAQRFSLPEVEPGQLFDNAERITAELLDLLAVLQMVEDEAGVVLLPPLVRDPDTISAIETKRRKVERYLRLSAENGTLVVDPAR